MALLSAQVSLASSTGLPADEMINTYWFEQDVPGDFLSIEGALQGLYTALVPIMTSQAVAASGHTIKIYDQGDTPPRVPVFTGGISTTGIGTTTAMPREVAIVSSFQATPVSGVNQASRRGRVYLGGLSTATVTSGGLINAGVVTDIADAFEQFQADVAAISQPTFWGVYSRKLDSFAPVTNGFVNNEFDTQRRRGIAATSRTTWSV